MSDTAPEQINPRFTLAEKRISTPLTPHELSLLRYFVLFRLTLCVLVLLSLAWLGYDFYRAVNSPGWSADMVAMNKAIADKTAGSTKLAKSITIMKIRDQRPFPAGVLSAIVYNVSDGQVQGVELKGNSVAITYIGPQDTAQSIVRVYVEDVKLSFSKIGGDVALNIGEIVGAPADGPNAPPMTRITLNGTVNQW